MVNSRYAWVILPYLVIFLGMIALRSAWGALVGFHLSLLVVLLPNWRTAFLHLLAPVSKSILFFVAITGLIGGAGLWVAWPYTGLLNGFMPRVAGLGLSGPGWLPFIVYFTLVNPWLEEAYWRNYLYSQSKFPDLGDFLFAGYHLIILGLFVGVGWMALAFGVLVAAGWFWRQVSRYTKSLLPAVLAHMLADLSILLVLYGFAT